MNKNDQNYGEFKGSTEATLRSILEEIKDLRLDMHTQFEKFDSRLTPLENFKMQIVGAFIVINIAWELLREKILSKAL